MSGIVRRWLLAAGGVVVAVLSVHLCGHLAQASDWASLGTEVRESVRPRSGMWRVLRGTLHFLEIPALLAVAAAVGYAAWRRDRRAAITFAVVLLVTNLLVQGVKHGPLPTPRDLNPLSGHAGLSAGLSCAWVLTGLGGENRRRRLLLSVATLVLAGTGGAVLLTGWHTLPQVLAPIGIGTGCALIGRAIGPADLPAPTTRRGGYLLVVVAVAVGLAALWGLDTIADSGASRVGPALAVLLAMVVAATSMAVGVVGLGAGFAGRGSGAVASAN